MPIGVLPGGSGNAMATTLAKKSELNVGVWENALLIAKGHVREMDLMLFQIENKRIYSFLSLTWAYLADVDLNSENLRFLGDARFEVYGTWRALF